MALQRLNKGDKWSLLPTIINPMCDVLESLVGATPGPGLAKTAAGQLYSTVKPGAEMARENYDGGTVLVLDRSNPTVTWSKADDKCPVSWIGNYVMWVGSPDYKFVQHERTMTYDRGGNLVSIGAEVLTDIVVAEECVPAS